MFKTKLLFAFFTIIFILILIKLFYIQILTAHFSPNDYLKTKQILPQRGKIYDRNNQPLVGNQIAYLLYAEPKKINDEKTTALTLASIFNIDPASIEAKLDKKKDWVVIKSGINPQTKESIIDKKITGLGFEEQSKRYYPEASLAAHLLGFVGKNEKGEDIGYFGLEGFYNKDLSGLPGLINSERDLNNRPIFVGTQEKIEPEDGRDLVLTIDKSVQNIIKKKLLAGIERYQAKQGCIIVADPYSMAILGLVCLPDFDLDQYYLFNEEFFKNPAISNLYEPGSIFKPIIMAAAIDNKVVEPDDFYDEEGPIKIGDSSIKTWNDKYEGKISMTRILEKSSNVGMVYIGQKLGEKKIFETLEKFGFGQLTGIDLQGEVAGFIKPKKDWYPIDFATVTFGQGIAVTPIQMIRAFAAVINGGYLYRPYLVSHLLSDGKEQIIKPKIERKILSEKTSQILIKMLVSTIENGETSWIKPPGYKIGGKTGTAQIPIQGHYDPTKTTASFIGFAPAENPKFIALVMLKEPQTSPWGSETAAPIFFDIANELLIYYNIAPEQ
ncbi:MAG: penicillin-binding protein 2 [Microgenomates group bacterium]|nr:penicillin-binding protein 2 [Microgenomates group bacterium]